MKHFLLTFLILQSICSLAQNKKLILTENANNSWFLSLNKTEELSEKIDLINYRLINDINVYIEWGFVDGITEERILKLDSIRKNRVKGFCKPLYVVKYKNKQITFRIENPVNSELTNLVSELVTRNNISGIEVLTDDRGQVLYGASANCGIVFIFIKKRKIYKAFKKLKLTNFYMDEIESY
jgi:hypothetical protein